MVQVHSTTKEIPSVRFAKARQAGNTLFCPFALHFPQEDVFCLRETRVVDGYRRVSLFNHTIEVPNVPLREDANIHIIPDTGKQMMELPIWWRSQWSTLSASH